MDNETVTFTEVNLAKYTKRKQIKPKGTNCSFTDPEQEIPCVVELNLQNASQGPQGNDKNSHSKDFPSCPERLIVGILGILCLVLKTSVITMAVIITTPSPEIQELKNYSLMNRSQKAFHCRHCPEEWFTYFNNCYYISPDLKTWKESLMACVSKKSHLFYMDTEEEMNMLSFLSVDSWVGLSRKTTSHPWQWINDLIFKKKVKSLPYPAYNCAFLHSNGLQADSCISPRHFICKHVF